MQQTKGAVGCWEQVTVCGKRMWSSYGVIHTALFLEPEKVLKYYSCSITMRSCFCNFSRLSANHVSRLSDGFQGSVVYRNRALNDPHLHSVHQIHQHCLLHIWHLLAKVAFVIGLFNTVTTVERSTCILCNSTQWTTAYMYTTLWKSWIALQIGK